MPSPTTLRAEMLHQRDTFNDKFFLTLGEGAAGMSPYNPLQLGLGVRLRVMTNNNVNAVQFFMRHVASGTEIQVRPTLAGSNRWELEGAVGGAKLGFPQTPMNYYVPQCFELRMVVRNRGRTDQRTYNFWVAEGPVGSIVDCIDRVLSGAKSLVCCFDGLGFRGYGYPDEFAQFFLDNSSPVMDCIDDEGEGLLPDPTIGVYVVGSGAPIIGGPAPADPWRRDPGPPIPSYVAPESDMVRLRAGYGDQWKYRRPITGGEDQHGREIERFSPVGVGAIILPAVANTLPPNPYLGTGQTPVGVTYPGPNDGVSARGPNADYRLNITLGDVQQVSNPGMLLVNLRCFAATPGFVYLFAGLAADWVGGANLGDILYRDNTIAGTIENWLTSVQNAGHYGVVTAGAWVAGAPGTQYTVPVPGTHDVFVPIDLSAAGLAPVAGQVWAIQAVAFTTLVALGVSPGILGKRFNRDAVISNAARFSWIP